MHEKKILFLINSFVIGGAERVFVVQANELSKRGWDVHVATLFTPGPLAQELLLANGHFHDLTADSIFDLRSLLKLRRIAKREKIQIIYSTLNEANTFARFFKVIRPSLTLITRESNMADVKPLFYKLIDIVLGIVSDRIIAVSAAVDASITAHAPWLRKKIAVLHNGVLVPAAPTMRPVGELVKVLSVGSLTPKKDHTILIDAMSLLSDRFLLTIVGSGALQRTLQEQASALGLQTRVAFSGAVPATRMAELYRSHDLFVLPSSREGCPNVVSEAQSFSLPTIAFDIAGMQEFVDEFSGLLVKERSAGALAKAIEACADPEKRRVLGIGGYEKVSRERSYEAHFTALVSLLESAR